MAGSFSPQGGASGVHINAELTSLSIAYHPDGMIAEQVFPVIPVKHLSDTYWKWDKGQRFNLLRSDGYGSLVADGTRAKELKFGATRDTYTAQPFKHAVGITDLEMANADVSLALETERTRAAQDIVLLDYETRVANTVTTAGSYASANKVTNSGTSQWNNASFTSQNSVGQSVIAGQILTGIDAVRQSTGGLYPTHIIIPAAVMAVMRNDKGLNDMVKYTSNTIASGNPFGDSILGLNILMPRAMSQNVAEGEATSLADVWGKSVVIFYRNPNPGLNSLVFGLTMRQTPWQVRQWREEAESRTMYEAGFVQAEKSVTFDCAYIIINAIA